VFLKLTGMGRAAFDAAVSRGLKTARIGKRVYVSGAAWRAYVESQSR